MEKGIAITYGDIAPGAKENFTSQASETQFGNGYQNKLRTNNYRAVNYATPCETYACALDGTATPLPDNPQKTADVAFWSSQITAENGNFATPITLELKSRQKYSSNGFTITFDRFNNTFATRLNIAWYDAETLLSTADFTPNSATFFCNNKVESFNRVLITFYSLNMPQNRLRLESVDFGYGTVFYGNELASTRLNLAASPVSTEIPISSLEFMLNSKSDFEYSFQTEQPLYVTYNGENYGAYFVKSYKRLGKKMWEITAENYVAALQGATFCGGIYSDTPAADILQKIFQAAKVPYFIDEQLKNIPLSGHIPYGNCRDSLVLVCFASMSVLDMITENKVNVRLTNETIAKDVPPRRILAGQTVETAETVTAVRLTAHEFLPTDEVVIAFESDGEFAENDQEIQVEAAASAEKTTGETSAKSVAAAEKATEETLVKSVASAEKATEETSAKSAVSDTENNVNSGEKTSDDAAEIDTETDENLLRKRVTVVFSEPLHSLEITRGEILESSENHAVLRAESGCVLQGKKFAHSEKVLTKINPKVTAGTPENTKSVSGATLISSQNAAAVLDRLYVHYMNNVTVQSRIVHGKRRVEKPVRYGEVTYGEAIYGGVSYGVEYDESINLLDVANVATEYSGVLCGCVVKQAFSVSGGVLVKDTTVLANNY